MKILLTAINAKYIHTNLAIYSLRAYARKYKDHIKLAEYTINNYLDDILQGIYKEKPDVIGFSCYIWNIAMIEQLCVELRKVLPHVKIWLGGPEVSYDARMRLEADRNIDGIIIGEGEETFKELLDYYFENKATLEQINGLAYREAVLDKIIVTGIRQQLNFSTLPFPYEDMNDFENKIIYYETSRGCPYSCSYCLSSIDKRVRLRNLSLVQEELQIFLNHNVPQVKFVDRTFNCNKTHTLGIWNYIKEHDNGITNFHFELSADILDDEELTLLNSMREGLVQLEIGVQSTNPKTIDAIQRKMNMEKLSNAVNRIHEGKNIHEHLDLIAGLPYEDYTSFQQSFCDVYALKPDQFQLGFLKVLKGSGMHEESKEWGIVYKSTPPFEVLFTNWLSFDEVLNLKSVENMVEIYYNSGQFVNALAYMEHFFPNPFCLYESLGNFYEKHNLTIMSHSRVRRFEILIDFMIEYKNRTTNVLSEEYKNRTTKELTEEYKNQTTKELTEEASKEINRELTDKNIEETTKETAEERLKGIQKQIPDTVEYIDIKAFSSILLHDMYLRENLKSRPSFAESQEEYKALYRNFYSDDEKLREYIKLDQQEESSTQLKPYVHLEHYSINIEQTVATGKAIPGDQFILYDYMHRNPLNNQSRDIIVSL